MDLPSLFIISIATGASNDIEQTTKIARLMVAQFGMCDELGMVALQQNNTNYLGADSSFACSNETQTLIDKKVMEIIKKSYEKVKKILLDNKIKLDMISKYLY